MSLEAVLPHEDQAAKVQGDRTNQPGKCVHTLTTSMGCTNIHADMPLAPAIPKLRAVGIPPGVLVDIVVEGRLRWLSPKSEDKHKIK